MKAVKMKDCEVVVEVNISRSLASGDTWFLTIEGGLEVTQVARAAIRSIFDAKSKELIY